MEKEFDCLVFIGRFQPFHLGHYSVINEALELSKQVIILVGSSLQPRSIRNPFSYLERSHMIGNCFGEDVSRRIIIKPLHDHSSLNAWTKEVQELVGLETDDNSKIGLIGHSKDSSSYYLQLFPQWESIEAKNHRDINATDLREKYFNNNLRGWVAEDQLNKRVIDFLDDFSQRRDFEELRDEYCFIQNYKDSWEEAPYPPTFVTVDAVVVQSAHILLIRRKDHPGKGLCALPGGFINQDEFLLNACIRELREETKLKVAVPVLKGSIEKSEVFDDPNRSSRGRTITHAYLFELDNSHPLPKVHGGDDAEKAFWMPLADLASSEIFEDHYLIIQKMLNL